MKNQIAAAVLLVASAMGVQADTPSPDDAEKLGRCHGIFAYIGFYKQTESLYRHVRDLTNNIDDSELAFAFAYSFGTGSGSYYEMLATLGENSPTDAKARALDLIDGKLCYRIVNSIDAGLDYE
ncbi:MAG: hypothetical protein ABJL54_16095 [Halioglobus sp.]